MATLKGKNIYLRALEPEDLDYVHDVENNEDFWELSSTQTPYSRYILKEYLENSHRDIYDVKQLRLVISDYAGKALGLIDLFDFDFKSKKAAVGILVSDSEDRHRGIGSEALRLLVTYSFDVLNLHQLYCNIAEDNLASLNLFTSQGF
ncbi:MAG TPA: GNAT family N-acetyltransferase, partial [Aquaticitalea sp.]|nr:GNAT family N-acetyltransferase [Aquaticitalea sp.]